MRHDSLRKARAKRPLVTVRRFQLVGALIFAAILPYVARSLTLPGAVSDPPVLNALIGNAAAVILTMWMRLSIETYPGIRSSYVILPAALAGHGIVVAGFLLTRFPYDRGALLAGLLFHVLWNYILYFLAQRHVRLKIAVVPLGAIDLLTSIKEIDWVRLRRAKLEDSVDCNAIVADFSADLPDEWEAFLADAALAGRVVYQVKQLWESLTGRVQLDHLSENSFGSLLPTRGYFHLKSLMDFAAAAVLLPLALPLMAAIALAIRLDSKGPVLFRQARIGHAGRRITVYKFRTMREVKVEDERRAAMTGDRDERITRVGAWLRRTRLDELPQIFNILKWEMSWIGPRPEAEVLSAWYTGEIPFYRYRHVVKPGISGWAQVNQGHVAAVDEVHRKLQYDFYYVKYFSPWLDLLILFRTVKTVLTGFGSR